MESGGIILLCFQPLNSLTGQHITDSVDGWERHTLIHNIARNMGNIQYTVQYPLLWYMLCCVIRFRATKLKSNPTEFWLAKLLGIYPDADQKGTWPDHKGTRPQGSYMLSCNCEYCELWRNLSPPAVHKSLAPGEPVEQPKLCTHVVQSYS